jgi:ankyrin repeat protein
VIENDEVFDAVERNDLTALTAMLDERPELSRARQRPYEQTLLHAAAKEGRVAIVELLLARGLDVNSREKGDNTYPLHWAAAAAHVDVTRMLIDAGGDVVGEGDDHELSVIGWATCWDGCDDDAHRAVVELLVRHGARHHVFSAIAMNLDGELRRLVAEDPGGLAKRMSRNESNQTPLHFAVRMNRPAMAALLIELGADPLAVDAQGQAVAAYAKTMDADRPVMEAIRKQTQAELVSAERGSRASRASGMDLVAALALEDFVLAERLVGDNRGVIDAGNALHLMAQRGDIGAVRWLLDHGANPNAAATLGQGGVTALHLAAWNGRVDIATMLLDAGADPTLRDTEHDSDPLGWAEFAGQRAVVHLLRDRGVSVPGNGQRATGNGETT